MQNFARTVITLTVEGLSIHSIERLIISLRTVHVASLQLKLNHILTQVTSNIQGSTSIEDTESVGHLYKPYPSNDLIYNCFLNNFVDNKHIYFQTMASLPTVNSLSFDHTFKVAANIGYLRPDGKWITQYNSLFIVLNNVGQVIAWQFTKTSSIDECNCLLLALKDRMQMQGTPLIEVYVDNCCTTRGKIQALLGNHVHVCLDIFHATQQITKVIQKRHPLCRQVMKDINVLFRKPEDKGEHRTLPTPSADILLSYLEFFITKWKDAEVNGWYIINDKVLKQLDSLKLHISWGCLSGINPGCGTNRNENLHWNINPFFNRCKMGIPLALALLTVLFHWHNEKMSPNTSVISARVLHPICNSTNTVPFGILRKTGNLDIDNWIFGSKLFQTIPQCSFDS